MVVMAVLGQQLDSLILEVFSKVNDFMIQLYNEDTWSIFCLSQISSRSLIPWQSKRKTVYGKMKTVFKRLSSFLSMCMLPTDGIHTFQFGDQCLEVDFPHWATHLLATETIIITSKIFIADAMVSLGIYSFSPFKWERIKCTVLRLNLGRKTILKDCGKIE